MAEAPLSVVVRRFVVNGKKCRRAPEGKFFDYKKSAKERGIEFAISFEEFMTFWQN